MTAPAAAERLVVELERSLLACNRRQGHRVDEREVALILIVTLMRPSQNRGLSAEWWKPQLYV